MDQLQERPTVKINIEDSEYARNWSDVSRAARENSPVAWSTELGGFWVATRHQDILAVLQDDPSFTAAKTVDPDTGVVTGGVAIPPMPIPRVIPNETDREEWKGFRNLLNPRMGPRAAESFRERARGFANALIDRVIERGQMDLVDDFTSPLTALVTMELVGFPLDEWRAFADPLHRIVFLDKSSAEFPEALAALEVIRKRIGEEIDRNREAPGNHMIGYLVSNEIDGKPINRDDLHSIVFNLLFGGVDTTTALTSNTLVHLWRHPDQRAKLRDDRSLLPIAREEFLRFYSPIHGTVRTARHDIAVAGQTVKAGEPVFLHFAAGNRDPEVFDRPEEVDLGRFPNRHVAFSAGIHRCAGSFFARMMFDVMLETVLDRLPDYVVCEDQAQLYPTISPVNGWINVPITFPAGPRLSPTNPHWLRD